MLDESPLPGAAEPASARPDASDRRRERGDRGARTLGILGDGQLARFLAQAALRLGVTPVVLASSRRAPAAVDGAQLVLGELDDESALARLVASAEVVTVENEVVDLERLAAVHARSPQTRLLPGLAALSVTHDKLAQKQLLDRIGAPTAAYRTVLARDLACELPELWSRFPRGFVLKWSRFGYDGRGVLAVPSAGAIPREELVAFCRAAEARGATVYAEERIAFEAELAMIATRAADGTLRSFPLVLSRQEDGVCVETVAPAAALGLDPALEERAAALVSTIASTLEWCGTLAAELFLGADGELLVNELAPRVHNSGHYTLFDDGPSQFDLHVRAVTGRALPRPRVRGLALMRNLLAPADVAPDGPCGPPELAPPAGVALHWYGKERLRPGRKMGHLTGRAASMEELDALRGAMRLWERRLWQRNTET